MLRDVSPLMIRPCHVLTLSCARLAVDEDDDGGKRGKKGKKGGRPVADEEEEEEVPPPPAPAPAPTSVLLGVP
jgi:hypothetical protein